MATDRSPTPVKRTFKERVLKIHKNARCFRGKDTGRYFVTVPYKTLGVARTPSGAWRDAWRNT